MGAPLARLAVVVGLVIGGAGCDVAAPSPSGSPSPSPSDPAPATSSGPPSASPRESHDKPPPSASDAAGPPVILLAVGDIARCGHEGDEATAGLLDQLEGTVLALGDLAYPDGTREDFERCFAPSWGRHKDRILPVIGNNEYDEDPRAYLQYFGERAAPGGHTWYSVDLGSWHVVVLDSNCDEVGGCGPRSPQVRWLRNDLARQADRRCTLAAMHHPLRTSGEVGDEPELRPLWEALYAAGVDVILSAHSHEYERFAPMTPGGKVDAERGIRSFIVGTGGAAFGGTGRPAPNSEARNSETLGVLRMTLWPDGYAWEFVPVASSSFFDGGSGTCH